MRRPLASTLEPNSIPDREPQRVLSAPQTRRSFLRRAAAFTALSGSGAGLSLHADCYGQDAKAAGGEGFTLPPLPYAYDALEPHIDSKTMQIHHNKHHQAYITNLNNALKTEPAWLKQPLEKILTSLDQLPEAIRTIVRNNAGGHANHSLFWIVMGPQAGGEPSGPLAEAINDSFGSFAKFKEQFSQAALKQFGSGWAWLYLDKAGKLQIKSAPNQDTPAMEGLTPILGLDVWEHAYYLKFQNLRADYIAAWWNVVNWKKVEELYSKAKA